MSLELTEQQKALYRLARDSGKGDEYGASTVNELAAIIHKLQAMVMRAEFYLEHRTAGVGCVACYEYRKMHDQTHPDYFTRHTWKSEQWMDAALAELSREAKG